MVTAVSGFIEQGISMIKTQWSSINLYLAVCMHQSAANYSFQNWIITSRWMHMNWCVLAGRQVSVIALFFEAWWRVDGWSLFHISLIIYSWPVQWKALKCQTLGAAVHVIVFVCWLEIDHCLVTLSYLPCAFCFVSACAKFAHEFQTLFERLVQLIFSFPSWFHTIWFYCSHTFHSFLSQITLCFSFGSKDMITTLTCLPSYRCSSFTLRAYLCWRHTYCQWPIIELAKNVSPTLT